MVSHLEVFLPEKPPTPRKIGEGLKGPQRKLWKEPLFVQYEKKKISAFFWILPQSNTSMMKKFLCSLIAYSTKEYECSGAWKFVSHHFENGSYQIQGIGFYHYCSTVGHNDSFRINIAITAMHRITSRILDVSNAFQNTNVPIHGRVCVIIPPYYLYWFEIFYPNVTLNRDNGPFCLQRMNGIQEKNPSRRQWNRLLDAAVTIIKYKKITIDHDIYIKVLYDATMSYLTVSTDGVLKTTNNET